MNTEHSSGFPEGSISEAELLRESLRERLNSALNSGLPAQRLAELLDASDYLRVQPSRSKFSGDIHIFDAERWVRDQLASNHPLQLPSSITYLSETILPPDEGEIIRGSGEGLRELDVVPRTRLLMEILTELGLEYSVIEGQNQLRMMRRLSYKAFIIPDLSKTVLVCNEEGNATFVVFHANVSEVETLLQEQKSTISLRPDTVWLRWSGSAEEWKRELQKLLVATSVRESEEPVPDTRARIAEVSVTERAPEGWLTSSALAKSIGRNNEWVASRVESVRVQHPEWFRWYLSGKNQPYEHVSPQVALRMQEENSRQEQAPEGWLTVFEIAKLINRNRTYVSRALERYTIQFPEAVRDYEKPNGRLYPHYGPEIVQAIEREVEKRPVAPDGWLTAYEISQLTGRSNTIVATLLNQIGAENPEWQRSYSGRKGGQLLVHYAPQLVQKVQEVFSNREFRPKGWLTQNELANLTGKTVTFVKPRLAGIRKHHPEWIKRYETARGLFEDHYAPEVFEQLSQEAIRVETAPDNWISVNQLRKQLGASQDWLSARIGVLEIAHPESVGEYLDSVGKPAKFVAPTIVERLRALRSGELGNQ